MLCGNMNMSVVCYMVKLGDGTELAIKVATDRQLLEEPKMPWRTIVLRNLFG